MGMLEQGWHWTQQEGSSLGTELGTYVLAKKH